MPAGFVTSAASCCGNLSTVARAMGCHAEETGRSAQTSEPWWWTHTQKQLFCNYFNEQRRFPEFLSEKGYHLDGHV